MDEQKNEKPEIKPEVEVPYTEAFAQERARRNRRAELFGAIACMICGISVIHDTVIAMRTGTSVILGRAVGLQYPPFIAGPVGVLTVLGGLWLFADLIFRRPNGK